MAYVTIPPEEIDRQAAFCAKIREKLTGLAQARGREFLAYTETFGCQQNENDTERIDGMLERMGYGFTDSPADADLVLYNTCAVRDHAEQRVYGKTGALLNRKRVCPECIVALCGCMVQQEGASEQIRKKYRHVDLVFGPHALYRFPENLWKVLSTGTRVFDNEPSDGNIAEGLPIRRKDRNHAWVSIMSGCNNFCSYCIVPYVRGRERSRAPQDILAEVRTLIESGYREITLLGQNVNSYGKDREGLCDFSDLLKQIDAIPGEYTLSFMTSHPKDASEKLLETIAQGTHISRHLHLPFQSGNDRVLKLMNRHYDRATYLALIEKARKIIPGVVFTSDVIVGFPTETEEEFRDTLSLVEQVGFDGLFTFLYSPRDGTPAAAMEDQIPEEIKKERYERLCALQTRLSEDANRKRIGQTVRVRVTGTNDRYPGHAEGRTAEDKIVLFPSSPLPAGTAVSVKIERATNWAMFGTLENQPIKF